MPVTIGGSGPTAPNSRVQIERAVASSEKDRRMTKVMIAEDDPYVIPSGKDSQVA
jgi:hypothetical protein